MIRPPVGGMFSSRVQVRLVQAFITGSTRTTAKRRQNPSLSCVTAPPALLGGGHPPPSPTPEEESCLLPAAGTRQGSAAGRWQTGGVAHDWTAVIPVKRLSAA